MTNDPAEDLQIRSLLEGLASAQPEEAWHSFLHSYSSLIYHILSFLDPDPDNRGDSFLFVCRHLQKNRFRRLRQFKVDGPASFSTWMRAVVRNLYLDWRRTQFGRQRSSVEQRHPRPRTVSLDQAGSPDGLSLGDTLAHRDADPELRVLLSERRWQLEKALEKLTSSEVRVIELRFREDLTLEQISHVVGLGSPQSARYRLQKALKKLKSHMK